MLHKFTAQSKMNDLIKENSSLLLTISRFGLPLGFGDKTIQEICTANKVDVHTFLAVVNFICEGEADDLTEYSSISIETVINYLRNAHTYFLSYKLPSIRLNLIEAICSDEQDSPYKSMIMNFFDDYVKEVQKHMEYENKTVFPYVIKLLSGDKDPAYNIAVFEQNHENIDSKVSDLKNILIKYYPAKRPNYLLNDVLFDLLACEKDLNNHNQVEDFFFVPVIEAIEKTSV